MAVKADNFVKEFSELATCKASFAIPGDPTVDVSLIPSTINGFVAVVEFPADTTHKTPSSVAFFIATCSGEFSSLKPATAPKDMLITSAPN